MTVEIDGANNIIKTNTISEVTSANGVTVDGLSIKDSKLVTANSVITTNITDANVTTAKITDANVTQGKIADQAINEAKMQISNAPTNGYALTAQSGNTGGMTWASVGEDNTPYFSAKGSGTQTASNNANTTLQFNTLVDSLDSASGYNTNNYDYTVQSGGAGLWYLRAGFYFSGASNFSSGNQVQIQLAKNNADFMSANVFYGGQTDGWVYTHSLAKLAVGNTLKVICYQNTGGNITAYLNNYHNSIFAGFRVKSI